MIFMNLLDLVLEIIEKAYSSEQSTQCSNMTIFEQGLAYRRFCTKNDELIFNVSNYKGSIFQLNLFCARDTHCYLESTRCRIAYNYTERNVVFSDITNNLRSNEYDDFFSTDNMFTMSLQYSTEQLQYIELLNKIHNLHIEKGIDIRMCMLAYNSHNLVDLNEFKQLY